MRRICGIQSRSMRGTPGSIGTTVSLWLRLGQTFFSTTSLLFMAAGVDYYSYTIFCFLVTIMSLAIPWSCSLAVVDLYAICVRCHFQYPGLMIIIAIGDWTLSILSLAAACSSSAVADVLRNDYYGRKMSSRYQFSATMSFFSWFLSAASALCNLWLVASL
ncbi:CASP-like protein [Zostera marina]|uniref:CASP-like protein n=1 Tax=Zostera marina TaxID=29655 RepID=A0A0K9Q2B7_ZOSMR|nr:CASP-like protein [Zostera marina]